MQVPKEYLDEQLKRAVEVAGGNSKEVKSLFSLTCQMLSVQQDLDLTSALVVFTELCELGCSSYDSAANRRRIWRLLLAGAGGETVPLWQFVCPPKTTLKGGRWVVEDDPDYDVFGPSWEKTKQVETVLRRGGLPFHLWLFYPDDEIVKARASGLKLARMPSVKAERLKSDLAELSRQRVSELRFRVANLATVELWTEAAARTGLDVGQMFVDELSFWKGPGRAKGIAYFKETERWLRRSFGFGPKTAFELTARRLAKYAVEGRVISTLFPKGGIYLNNEFPFKEPWSMYLASLTPEERDQMSVLFYLNSKEVSS